MCGQGSEATPTDASTQSATVGRPTSGRRPLHRLVAQFVWEVQWDGPKNRFAVVLDETAIAQDHSARRRAGQPPTP